MRVLKEVNCLRKALSINVVVSKEFSAEIYWLFLGRIPLKERISQNLQPE